MAYIDTASRLKIRVQQYSDTAGRFKLQITASYQNTLALVAVSDASLYASTGRDDPLYGLLAADKLIGWANAKDI